jgi:hypothetical protein
MNQTPTIIMGPGPILIKGSIIAEIEDVAQPSKICTISEPGKRL